MGLHVVFVPKRRRKVLFGKTRRQLREVFHALARQKECQILDGHLMPDHAHRGMAIPPKHPVASVIVFLKGKSPIAVARLWGRERNFSGEHIWARGYAVPTDALPYSDQGKFEQAEPLYKTAITSDEKTLGREHPQTAVALNKLALPNRAQHMYADGETLYEGALAIDEKALGPGHSDVAIRLNREGRVSQCGE